MVSKVDLVLQVFEKFGAPVFSAVAGTAKTGASFDPKDEAAKVSALVVKAGQAGASLAELAGVKPDDAGGNASRLAFGGVSAAALSQLYRESGRLPSEADVERLNAVFASVLSFAEDFAPIAQGSAGKLAILGSDALLDETQVDAMVLHALAPVVGAVAVFSFGRPEKGLAQEIVGRLTSGAAALAKRLFSGPVSAPQGKLVELTLLRALSGLFVSCYVFETERLLALDEAARAALAGGPGGALPLDPVWEAFALRVGMLETLADGMFSGAKELAQSDISLNPLQKELDSGKSPIAKEVSVGVVSSAVVEKSGSPMGFFAKKKKDE